MSINIYCYEVRASNIAHFYHAELPFIYKFLNNFNKPINIYFSYYTETDIWFADHNKKFKIQWICDLLKILILTHNHVLYEKIPKDAYKIKMFPNKLKFNHTVNINICKQIRTIIFNRYNIPKNRIVQKYKVFYTRKDCGRRNIYNYEILKDLFDIFIDNLSISLKDQVELFSRTTHFVSVEGAHMTNIAFMRPDAKVLSIQMNKQNSWAKMFKLNNMIEKFDTNILYKSNKNNKTIIKNNKTYNIINDTKKNNDPFNDDLYIDNDIKNKIKTWLNK